MTMRRILYAPGEGLVEQGGTMATAVLDEVFDKLGLPADLRGERAAKEMDTGAAAAGEKAAAAAPATATAGQAKKPDEAAAAAAGAAAATEKAQPEFSDEQRAWLEATDEQRAKLTEPQFTDEQRGWIEQEQTKAATAAAAEPTFTPEQKNWLTQRDQTHAKELEAAKAEATTAAERAQQAEAKLAGNQVQPMAVAPVPEILLLDDTAKIDAADQQYAQFEEWALAHWDGTEAVEAKGDQPAVPAYSAQQIRQRYHQVKELRGRMVPAARQALASRQAEQAKAREQYPELFDPKRPESQLAARVLQAAPGLKVLFPNIWTILGDAMAGEKLRLAKEKAAAEKAAGGKAKIQVRGTPIKAARPGAGLGTAAAGGGRRQDPVTAAKFMELGGDRNALVQMLQGADLPTAEK